MADLSGISEHMEVVGADGVHVGTVDKVEGNRIKLTRKDDPTGSGEHYYLPLGAVATVQDGKVKLMMPASAATGETSARDPGA